MKLDPTMGLVFIEEQTSPEQNMVSNMNVVDKNGIFYVEFDSCLHSFDVMNRNSRMYKAKNISECLNTERIQSYLSHGGWYGEMNHPTSKYENKKLSSERIQDIDMGNTSHRMLNPHVEGNLLVSRIQTDAGTDAGMNLARKMVQGFIPGFSCRAIASLFLEAGKPTVNARKIITYDWVLYQSHREAEQIKNSPTKFINKVANTVQESVQGIMIPLKEILESVGKTDVNTQIIMESFDLTMDDIVGLSNDNRQLIVKDNNNMIYCNMDTNSRKKVNEYLRSF
jgi:hypothetical protein